MRPDNVGLGGFDSHAFPPLCRLLAAGLLVTGLLAHGSAAAAPASVPAARADSVIHVAAPAPDTLAHAVPADTSSSRVPKPLPWSEQPRAVMLRSLVVPGWGQWHNHQRTKAVVVAGVEGWLVGRIVSDKRAMDRLLEDANAAQSAGDTAAYSKAAGEYNDRLDSFVAGQWLLGAALAYSLIDAYVDAHFRTFEIDFRNDPALPQDPGSGGGPPASAPSARSARVSLRWHF